METTILKDIVIVFGLSLLIIVSCQRIKVPSILGFLIAGIICGPHGLGLLSSEKEVEILAEIGVVFLLFTIGIEFSLKNLIRLKRAFLIGGSAQVILSVAAVVLIGRWLNFDIKQSLFIGFLFALSSTAIVLKGLQDKGDLDSPYGSTSLAILIFQDLIIVPMILIVPYLAHTPENTNGALSAFFGKLILFAVVMFVAGKWLVPFLLERTVRTRKRELFMLSLIFICITIAYFSYTLGLSLALGAFMAGLIISRSEYSHNALSDILPFKEVFVSFFFISIGMLFDFGPIFENPILIFSICFLVIFVKSNITGLAVTLLGYPMRTAVLTGMALCQVGEFSFILSKEGAKYALISDEVYQIFLSVTVMTMAASPLLLLIGPKIAEIISKLPIPKRIKSGLYPISLSSEYDSAVVKKDHSIIVGFGINGKNTARALRLAGLPYVIVETNPQTVKTQRKKGEPIIYGDATTAHILIKAGIRSAATLIIVIADHVSTSKIAAAARSFNSKIHIIARTKFTVEVAALLGSGVDSVVTEEFETSLRMARVVLERNSIPDERIDNLTDEIRSEDLDIT